MSNRSIKNLLILGALAILGIILIQAYWVVNTWYLNDENFDTSVRIALRKTAESIAEFNNSNLPKQNIIQRKASNTYVVNINDEIDAQILEDYLIQHFEKNSLKADFEYAIYDCGTAEMLYGNYCDIASVSQKKKNPMDFPKFKGLEYYFAVHFPSRAGYILSNMRQAIWFSLMALLAIAFFIYASFIILRQRRYSEMQRDFINNMTHEFKTPISSIKLAANSIAKDDKIAQDPRLSKYVHLIDEQSIRLNEQVEKLLNVAALDKKQFELQMEALDLVPIVEDVISNVELRIKNRQGQIHFKKSTEHITQTADRVHLTNIIYNLLDNAIKYSPKAPEITVHLDENGFTVQDQGIGIEQKNLTYIYDKFYRVPTGNIHNVKGFGLGLYYVKLMVNKFGWTIDMQSKLNQGTKVRINF